MSTVIGVARGDRVNVNIRCSHHRSRCQLMNSLASFNNDPGFVCERPLNCNFARSGASRRSIVAGDITINANSVSSLMVNSSNRRSRGTRSAITGANRLARRRPQHRPAERERHHNIGAVQRRPSSSRVDHPAASVPTATPSARDHGANQSSRTTHPRSTSSPVDPPQPAVATSSVPSTGPTQDPTSAPRTTRTGGHFWMSQRRSPGGHF